jgi:hypothetical protein
MIIITKCSISNACTSSIANYECFNNYAYTGRKSLFSENWVVFNDFFQGLNKERSYIAAQGTIFIFENKIIICTNEIIMVLTYKFPIRTVQMHPFIRVCFQNFLTQ